jgi:DNA-binding GntR family transcriptional regulator
MNKTDRVYEALRGELARGEWPFGEPFSTSQLAERFGVSRQPVLDAVQRLQSDGFVEIIPQVGCRVVVPDEKQLRDHLELSAILEAPAARMAAERATRSDIDELARIHERATPIVEARDAQAYPRFNREFHSAILEIAGNRGLAAAAESAWDLREFYFQPNLRSGLVAVLAERHADHARILDAISRHDGELAYAAMQGHLDPEHSLLIIGGGKVADVKEVVAAVSV